MSRFCLYQIKYTQKVPRGYWESHDDLRITGYDDAKEFSEYTVAPNKELAQADWLERHKYIDKGREMTFVSVEQLESNIRILVVI